MWPGKIDTSLAELMVLYDVSDSFHPHSFFSSFLPCCLPSDFGFGEGGGLRSWTAGQNRAGQGMREDDFGVQLGGCLCAYEYLLTVGHLPGIARWSGRYQSWSCRAAVGQEASGSFVLEKWWRRWRQRFWWGATRVLPEGTWVKSLGGCHSAELRLTLPQIDKVLKNWDSGDVLKALTNWPWYFLPS